MNDLKTVIMFSHPTQHYFLMPIRSDCAAVLLGSPPHPPITSLPMSDFRIMGTSTNSIQDSQVIEAPPTLYLPSQSQYRIQLSLCWESLIIHLALLKLSHTKNDLMRLSLNFGREPEVLTATLNFIIIHIH